MPSIFSKKLNNTSKIIHLNREKTVLGAIKYFPPTNQEWSNSVYVYNGITIKGISVAQRNLTKLLKSYFNIFFNKSLIDSERTLLSTKRLATNKIFFSKAELKHTHNKVIITLYVYNEERRTLINKLERIKAVFYPGSTFLYDKPYKKLVLPFSLKKRLNMIEEGNTSCFLNRLDEIKRHISNEIISENRFLSGMHVSKLKEERILYIKTLQDNLEEITRIMLICKKYSVKLEYYVNLYKKFITSIVLEKDISIISYYKLLLNLNKSKFEYSFISRLNPLISRIYNKEVEFNIVNLKAIYLDSSILTEAISLKLRDRKNKLLKVLKSFLYMIKIRSGNVLKERYQSVSLKKLWENKVRNLTIKNSTLKSVKDTINNLFAKVFNPLTQDRKLKTGISIVSSYNNKNEVNLSNFILNDVLLLLKHKNMAGVRLEAKGRLTKRFTASRSVFKIKWKGSLKNIYSSYRGVSTVILRGHIKSNVQYSIINSKTRNGAFGLKGWISGK